MKLVMPWQARFYVSQPDSRSRFNCILRDDIQKSHRFPVEQYASAPMASTPAKPLIFRNERRRAQIGNRVYNVIPLALPLTPAQGRTLHARRTIHFANATLIVMSPKTRAK